MKNTYSRKVKLFAVLLFAAVTNVWGQLNGIVTIDATSPASPTNFQSFNALATALNGPGINGPLTVNVVTGSGPYNEQVTFNQITGVNATNTITINGNGNTITFNATVSNMHTFMLAGTDYMTVNNLTMIGTNSTYALVCHLYNLAEHNRFNNCLISAPVNATSGSTAPVSVSGSPTSAQTTGNAGNNNAWTTCTLTGGYWSSIFYGNTAAPFNTLNVVENSTCLDFYYSAFFTAYVQDHVFRNNIVERPNRTSFTTTYPVFINTGTLRAIVENNHIRSLYTANTAYTGAAYCIYIQQTASAGNENMIRNNIISDIRSNGQIYGVYVPGYNFSFIYNNTISLDDPNSSYTGQVMGIYCSTGPNVIKNNIITISRGGTGAKYGLYYAGGTGIQSNRNVINITSPAGVNYVGYWNANFTTLATWQTANANAFDAFSSTVAPVYMNPAAMNYSPTALAINNMGEPMGLTYDYYNATRSLPTPDPGAIEFFSVPCAGPPAANSVITPTLTFCPNTTVNIAVANTYSNAGYTYQWQSSTGSFLGPWTAISGATLATMVTPGSATISTFYSAVITCPNGGNTTASAGQVLMALPTVTTVPYLESFESLAPNNLPNCSWAVSNGAAALTQTISNTQGRVPRTGSKFAMFQNPGTTNAFYTNAIQLYAGITYSAEVFYITESVGYNNWSNLSILVGPNQSAANQQTIASTAGAAISPIHKQLSNTFTVATSGIYYVCVRATSISGSAPYLSWDDLAITIPCQLNEPDMSISLASNVACSGQPINMNVTGADSYTWSSGQNSNYVTVTPGLATTGYTVTGTNTLTGCSGSLIQPLVVNPSPFVFAFASSDVVCANSPVNLTANGSGIVSYNWSNGATGPFTTVTPTASTSYSVIGVNAFGCSAMDVKQIIVNAQPPIMAQVTQSNVCAGDNITILGSGGSSYTWLSNTAIMYVGNPLNVSLQSSAIFTVTGTDDNGCSNKFSLIMLVDACTGIQQNAGNALGIKLYPNPTNGSFTIESAAAGEKTMEVSDVSGRTILSGKTGELKTEVNLSTLANGIYYVKIQSGDAVEVIKVVKSN